jgi:DNA-binding response OmpR family regulator
MSAAAVRILVVGTSTASTESTLKGLARSGWESHAVKTVREADTVLRTIRFQLTLATEKLPDGTGYELASLVAQQTGNLFISVPLSETCLWLPAVENGVRSLGERALNPLMLKTEAESILRACDKATAALEHERGGRGRFFGEVVRGAGSTKATTGATAGATAGAASDERFVRQANGRFEHEVDTIPGGVIAPRRHELKIAEKSREHSLRLVSEDVVWDLGVSNKRWRA